MLHNVDQIDPNRDMLMMMMRKQEENEKEQEKEIEGSEKEE